MDSLCKVACQNECIEAFMKCEDIMSGCVTDEQLVPCLERCSANQDCLPCTERLTNRTPYQQCRNQSHQQYLTCFADCNTFDIACTSNCINQLAENTEKCPCHSQCKGKLDLEIISLIFQMAAPVLGSTAARQKTRMILLKQRLIWKQI